VEDGNAIVIEEGRHPVVEQSLAAGEFVPNDTALDADGAQIIVLTGPNMAGKSTYLRQVALIVVMAQAGCFVPARSARIGLVDRVFTRIGAHDELAAGHSTFMVEMLETAQILHAATPRSLVILDEVGRGTSTYDGMAIARAVIEYLHNDPRVAARTLFATHYHELTELESLLPRVRNYNVAVAEADGEVMFLRRILPGGADRSYGVHVAQLAGLPRAVVHRAEDLLHTYENGAAPKRAPEAPSTAPQLSLFGGPSPVEAAVAATDVDALTPLEAITRLYELRRLLRDESA
jgi:DNA mismatch repair protein MutS